MTTNDHHTPTEAIIVDDDGLPIGHINFDRLHIDATLLMYELAATAGNDQSTDEVTTRWAAKLEPDYMGYVAAAALSLMVRCIVAPTLDVTDRVGVDLRNGLKRAAADALRDLGDDT